MGKPTISDVAREAHVSMSTASLALRGSDKVRADTRERVLAAADRLNFTLSKNASSLASGKTMRVSMLLAPSIDTWFNSKVLQGVYAALHPEGYEVIPYAVSTQEELEDFFTHLRGGKNADAAIVSSIDLHAKQKKVFDSLSMPVIGLNTAEVDKFSASICTDELASMDAAVRFLHSQGHRYLAFVGVPDADLASGSALRVKGFRRSAADLGYTAEDLTCLQSDRDYRYYQPQDAISQIVARLLTSRHRPTGICVETDEFAAQLMQELRRQGVRIPEDMSIIGFDDSPYAPLCDLTTIHQDPLWLGAQAAELTLNLITGIPMEQAHRFQAGSLVLRGSTSRRPQQRA